MDLDDQTNRQTLIDDFLYIAETYFDHPSYLKIDGRPVVSIYLTRIFSGDVSTALQALRDALANIGYDVYILGACPRKT